jgi:hypothetical protein
MEMLLFPLCLNVWFVTSLNEKTNVEAYFRHLVVRSSAHHDERLELFLDEAGKLKTGKMLLLFCGN